MLGTVLRYVISHPSNAPENWYNYLFFTAEAKLKFREVKQLTQGLKVGSYVTRIDFNTRSTWTQIFLLLPCYHTLDIRVSCCRCCLECLIFKQKTVKVLGPMTTVNIVSCTLLTNFIPLFILSILLFGHSCSLFFLTSD